jgi:protein N-terminal glutamine amidohydrolase
MGEITVIYVSYMKLETFRYTANFCEENIWHLCQNPDLAAYTKTVLIMSNSSRNCPLWHQQSAKGEEPVRWDYHVVLLASSPDACLIYDFDSSLDLPIPLDTYLERTFQSDRAEDQPFFKAIDSQDFIHLFNSDRSHMKDGEGNWKFSPPGWPLIQNKEALPLPELLDFSENSNHNIYALEEVKAMGIQN